MPSPAMPVKLVSSTDQAYGGLCKRSDFVDVTPWIEGTNFYPVPMLVSEYLGGGSAQGPAAWYRKGSGVTITGAGVSQWSDASGNGRHLVQSVDARRPALQSDGTILFDGVDNYLDATFTLAQPVTVYALMNQVSWTGGEYIFDGITINTMAALQSASGGGGASPAITQYAGGWGAEDATNMTVGAYRALCMVFSGASSLIQVGSNAPATGNAGTSSPGGFTIGWDGDQAGGASNIRVKEIMIFAQAHNAAQRAAIIAYLNTL